MNTSHIAIVGAGHAGMEAASVLLAQGCAVTIFSGEDVTPYFRPRLIAVAFGQAEPGQIALKPAAFFEQPGLTLRLNTPVTSLEGTTINGESFDGVILAQGSHPFVPPFQGEAKRLHVLWTMRDALALRALAHADTRLTVIGGGVLGLEAALRARLAGLRVTLVEAAPHLAAGRLPEATEQTLIRQLQEHEITPHIGVGIASIDANTITLQDGTTIADDIALCSTGARSNVALGVAAGFTSEFALRTDASLALAPRVYAAGDVAQPSTRPPCAVRRATMMGNLAAKNLLAELQGSPRTDWVEPQLPLFMKVGDVELRA